jgi:predicted Rossmann fold nucleotide-binding protein DprA/Smf involved in DNA uptake
MGLGAGQMKIGFNKDFSVSPVLDALYCGEKSIDELARVLKMPVSKTMNEVLGLELDGLVEEKMGKYFLVI